MDISNFVIDRKKERKIKRIMIDEYDNSKGRERYTGYVIMNLT